METEQFKNDIPLDTAIRAHAGISWTPEKRGESTRNDYANTLAHDWSRLRSEASETGLLDVLETEFARYREGYKARFLAYLHSNSRRMSSGITGPSNFPVRRMEKRNNIAHKRLTELLEFRERALKAIYKTLHPELRPVMSGDTDAVARLEAKIQEAEAEQERMKAVNTAHKRFLKDPATLDATDFPESVKATIRAYVPPYRWEPHPYPPYAMTNNSANIRRMKERLEKLKRDKAAPETSAKNEETGISLEDCPAENRIKLTFPGKPSEDVRTRLKSCGFRWTPSQGVWQAYRNNSTLETAKQIAGCAPVNWRDGKADWFIAEITELAEGCGKTPEAVYKLWDEYTRRCTCSDQSPLLMEFRQWYASDLQPIAETEVA